jgi:hypothetical protein
MTFKPQPIPETLDRAAFTRQELAELEARIKSRIEVRYSNCWRVTDSEGVLRPTRDQPISFRGKTYPAQRLLWMLKYGKVERGMYLWCTCNSVSCVNPDHYQYGTQQEMLREYDKAPPAITREKVAAIKIRYRQGDISMEQLSRELGITQGQLRKILLS